MRRIFIALALLSLLGTNAHARSLHAQLEGPSADGAAYTVRAVGAAADTPLEPWALAEGVVDGAHRTVLLRLEPTREHGVYRLAHTWPHEGRWVLRIMLGNRDASAAVVSLRADGSVERTSLHRHTDGFPECMRALG
ncbi:MAG: hypothetical protein ACKOC6_08755, partial [bacterium]